MRLICFAVTILFFSISAQAQKLTGIWRGYFVQKSFNLITGSFTDEKYKYEIQINQLANNELEGVTYSYKTIVFYGKASMQGIFTKQTKNVLIKELEMLDLKMSSPSSACAMTCYLDYAKDGNVETLTGTFTSVNVKDKTDCGGGSVYLEKVPDTDFEKEDFLLKKTTPKNITPPVPSTSFNPSKKDIQRYTIESLQKVLGLPADGIAGPKTITAIKQKVPDFNGPISDSDTTQIKNLLYKIKNTNNTANTSKPVITQHKKENNTITAKPTVKPGAEDFIVKKDKTQKIDVPKTIVGEDSVQTPQAMVLPKANIEKVPVQIPRVLKERENKLVNVIEVNVKDVQIDYYDNGEIDDDSISVYHDNKAVINHQRLSNAPISIQIHLDENNPRQELITVAENLGRVPPNTALMIITAGKKRQEVFITSDERKNAKIVLEYKPNKGDK
jgi:hypothetical protein